MLSGWEGLRSLSLLSIRARLAFYGHLWPRGCGRGQNVLQVSYIPLHFFNGWLECRTLTMIMRPLVIKKWTVIKNLALASTYRLLVSVSRRRVFWHRMQHVVLLTVIENRTGQKVTLRARCNNCWTLALQFGANFRQTHNADFSPTLKPIEKGRSIPGGLLSYHLSLDKSHRKGPEIHACCGRPC